MIFLASFFIFHRHDIGTFPHIAKCGEIALVAREGHLPLKVPFGQILRAIENCGAGEVLALDTNEHAVRAIMIEPHQRIAIMGGISGWLIVYHGIAGKLFEVHQIFGSDKALCRFTFPRLRVLDVTRIKEGELGHVRVLASK